MRFPVDRRAMFFYVFALLVLVMLIPCPEEFHYVGIVTAVTYLVLGTFSWLDAIARARSGHRRK